MVNPLEFVPTCPVSTKITGQTLGGPQVQLNKRVWPVIFDITGPICARTFKLQICKQLISMRASRLASNVALPEKSLPVLTWPYNPARSWQLDSLCELESLP